MVAEDPEHSIQVAEKALEIGGRMRTDLDIEFIGRGAETQFRDIFRDEIKYEKNEITTKRYSRYQGEIQGLMR